MGRQLSKLARKRSESGVNLYAHGEAEVELYSPPAGALGGGGDGEVTKAMMPESLMKVGLEPNVDRDDMSERFRRWRRRRRRGSTALLGAGKEEEEEEKAC